MIPNLVQAQIDALNSTVGTTNPTQENNPYQIYTALGSCRWLAVSGLFIFDYKGQTVRVPLLDSSEQNCWYNTLDCVNFNDPKSPEKAKT